MSGDSGLYCSLNVVLYLPELGTIGLIFVFSIAGDLQSVS